MKKKTCDNCEYKGYSQEVCRLHIKKMHCQTDHPTAFETSATRLTKSAACGAGIGAMTALAGVVAAPVIGLKALVAHIAIAKAGASGGVVGAGFNIARKKTVKGKKEKQYSQKRTMAVSII